MDRKVPSHCSGFGGRAKGQALSHRPLTTSLTSPCVMCNGQSDNG
jgi:hypothetical protein